ncbi:MAG TPA: alpha/beta fold hydrolase [Trebonia sp.]|jgi:pimeloyl-ACP methyl ester carboxylesterase|nr:alpha/beta fold hydrolase [Trebonia sp.]
MADEKAGIAMKRHTAGTIWGRRIAAGLTAATLATALAACGSAPNSATTADATSASTQVASTALGPVGYREVGSGPPLVLIMGYAGTMDTWEPQLVDALARHFRVVVFDNAGIGRTGALPAPLTVDAMANQTSALIGALRLGRADVLGWSMGGMIAQALAVLHPGQVRRLVLCATFPGVGTVIPPQAAINDLTNGNGLPVLFPADQPMAADAFVAQAQSYPDAESASAGVISAQGDASLGWFHGADAAGRRTGTIAAPTLVADGTQDRLDAVANSRAIARLIPGARLVLYPDAGHAFLFQEGTPFAVTVESFLAGPAAGPSSRPASTATIRAEFTAGEAAIIAAGTTWANKLKGLSAQPASSGIGKVDAATPTAAEVIGIDQPFASALGDLDQQLLRADATGAVGAAITTFVAADDRLATDVLALGGLSASTGAAWKPTITRDGDAERAAAAALRKDLGLLPQPSAG